MKKKLLSLLALVMTVMTASAIDAPSYNLTVGTNDHGTVKFYVGQNEVTTAQEGDSVKVVVTPATGWVVNQPAGQWIAAEAAARSAVPMLNGFELETVAGQENTYKFLMERANAVISVTYKKLLTNQDITIEDITALTYSGVAQEPVVTVKDGSVVLTKDVDYTVTYSNNTNAALATATENAPTVTITAVATSDKYAGETTKTFTILPKALEDGFIANIDALVYTGVAQTPEPAVTYNNMTLVKGTDFTYSYTNNVNVAAATAENAPTVTVTGKGNYTGTAQKKFDITTAALTVTADNKQVTFGDDAPQYTVSYDGFVNNETNAVLGGTLAFACSYVKNQTGAGNYDITPSGLTSSNYDITFTKGTLTVYKKHLDHPDITISNILPVIYNAQAHTPSFTVKDGSKVLVLGTDYTVTYSDNVMACDKDAAENAPTVTIKAVEGHNFYVGENSKTFTIRKKTLEDGFMSKVADLTYNGKAQEPAPTLTYDGMTLVEGTDYVFSYINNKDAAQATDAKAPVVTASAVKNSNFTGAASQKFNIKKAPLTVKANDVEVFYGEEPQFTVSYEGFVNEETEAVLEGTLAFACDYTKESAVGSSHDITPSGLTAKNYEITFTKGTLTVATDPAPYKESLQTAIAIASNINPEAFADAIAAAQAALTAEGATAESLVQAIQALETAIKTYFGEMLPKLGAIVEDLNEEALNTAYADAQAVLAKEGVTAQEMAAAMQNIITTAQTVAPAHLDNLRGYAVKYGAEGTAALVDSARAAIEEGNVSKIITTMTAVREAATPLATGILTQMIGYAQSYTGFEADVIEAQAVLEGGNYITMINTAKALHDKLIEAAKAYVAEAKAIPTEGKEGAAELNAAILAAEEALAGDETDFSAINTAISNLVAAVKAFKKANDEPIFIETDLTAQFPVDYQGWIGATGLVGWAAPAVTTNDGRQTAACERYEGTCGTLGDVFTRTLTGLTNGTYRIELYGAAAYTSGRGFDSELVEGDETAVYLYAETAGADASRRAGGQRVKQYIPAHVADNFNGTGIATAVLDNVVVTDGTVKLGMYKEKPYTNWHVVQIKGVTALVDGVELHANELAAAKAALNAEEYAVVTGEEKTALVTAISENATVAEQTAEGYKAAIKALSDATAAFTGAKAAYESYVAAQAYLVDLPYANAEKKPAAEAATNAADATAKAEALLVALRAYYESAALAENVAGAKVMTDSIKNPKAEDGINNWTVVKGEGSGGSINVLEGEPWTDAAGVAEHKYFDGGDWGAQAWDVALEQKIALPAGKYLLTTIARAEKAVDFTLYAGANSVKIPAISSVGGVFNRGWNNASVEFEMAEADSIVIGVRGVTSEIHNWMSFSDFRLVQLEGVTEIEMPEGVIYSWESPEGTPIEFGGTIAYVNGDGNRLNYLNSGNYTICLNGKKANLNDEAASANAGHMVITLDNAVAEGDTIAITGYITKNSSAKSSAWIVYENGATAESAVFGDESNIFVPEGGAATGAINTKYVIVSAEAAGSKTITLTRGQTGTNLFITKLQVISKKAEEPVETIETMYLMGDFTGGWDFQDTQKMTQDAENAAVWTLTVEAFEAEAKKYEYKATANAKWGLYELPSSGNYDFVFGTEGYPAGKYDLKFTVNTTDHTLTLEATKHIESGINTLKTAIENGNVYNMNGQRVNKAQKGLYIINGRKVVIK